MVFSDNTLAALATQRPGSPEALLEIPGIGAVKAERFGDSVLQLIADAG